MLTFIYNDHQVRISDTGRVDYYKDTGAAETVWTLTDDPPVTVTSIAAMIWPLVLSDVMKADLRVTQLREELRAAKNNVESAESAELEDCEACVALRDARYEAMDLQLELSSLLTAAEGALQLARAGE